MGLQADLPARDPLDIWPENELPLAVFCRMASTQWHLAPNGMRIGLRYEVMPMVLDAERVPRGQRPQVFSAVQDMEREALRLWSTKRR